MPCLAWQVEALWRESLAREAGLRAKLGEERQHFRARLDEYERLCHSLEQCLQSSKVPATAWSSASSPQRCLPQQTPKGRHWVRPCPAAGTVHFSDD